MHVLNELEVIWREILILSFDSNYSSSNVTFVDLDMMADLILF